MCMAFASYVSGCAFIKFVKNNLPVISLCFQITSRLLNIVRLYIINCSMVSLHEKYVSEVGADGRESKVPALSPSRMEHVDYIHYKPPPSDSADRASVEEWLDRARFIEEDSHWLLKLPHDRFSTIY